jgi:hypothetical protein
MEEKKKKRERKENVPSMVSAKEMGDTLRLEIAAPYEIQAGGGRCRSKWC